MNVNIYQTISRALFLTCFVGNTLLHAQYVPLTNSNTYPSPQTFQYQTNDATILAIGSFTGNNMTNSVDLGEADKFLWYPSCAAIRAGQVDSTTYSPVINGTTTNFTGVEWDNSATHPNVGNFSVAMGVDTVAYGSYSTAFGTRSTAYGNSSFTAGYLCLASGDASSALGEASTASGSFSFAQGNSSAASGAYSIAMGSASMAVGNYSTALGHYAIANGVGSVALGAYATANSYLCTTIGTYNTGVNSTNGAPSLNSWVAVDPLFEVGNGTSSTATNDAFVVYKNGNATAATFTTTATPPTGDIPMFDH